MTHEPIILHFLFIILGNFYELYLSNISLSNKIINQWLIYNEKFNLILINLYKMNLLNMLKT